MYQYKSWEYVQYVLNLPFIEGLELYNKCIGRFNDIAEQTHQDRQFKLYLFELEHCNFIGSFDEYIDRQKSRTEVKQMSPEEKDDEQNRILEMSKKIIKMDRERMKAK